MKRRWQEQLAIKNVGKLDPKRHLEEKVDVLMTNNVVQCLGAMLDTTVLNKCICQCQQCLKPLYYIATKMLNPRASNSTIIAFSLIHCNALMQDTIVFNKYWNNIKSKDGERLLTLNLGIKLWIMKFLKLKTITFEVSHKQKEYTVTNW